MIAARFDLHELTSATDAAAVSLVRDRAVERLWKRDYTLFSETPVECRNRMGWLETAEESLEQWPTLVRDAESIAVTCDHLVLMGMGGSSLFPEVLARTFGSGPGRPELHLLDTTHPDAIRRITADCDPARTFHLAASKSGSTIETRSHLAWCWERSGDPSRFGVITDPGSDLGTLAHARGFAHVWENDPDIGGRFAALSLFGMVPAALLGCDGVAILSAALDQAEAVEPLGDDEALNIGLRLGAAIGAAARAGRDQLTVLLDPRLAAFGAWIEQLVAESLGKSGMGVVPLIGETVEHIIATEHRRLVISIGDADGRAEIAATTIPQISLSLEETTDLGAQVFLWEFATALSGRVLRVNPFDQPDVESAKIAARRLLEAGAMDTTRVRSSSAETPLASALATIETGDHLALCAFVDATATTVAALEAARLRLGRQFGVATTMGIGPRFLHSTGQLHKGGPNSIVVLQIVGGIELDLAIPESGLTFGELFSAQAEGDLVALKEAGRRVMRVSFDELVGSAP